MNETYEEEDIFFGPISQKENSKIQKLGHRKTRYLGKAKAPNDEECEHDTGTEITEVSSLHDFKNSSLEDNLEKFKDTQKVDIVNVDVDLETCNYEEEKLININVNTNDNFKNMSLEDNLDKLKDTQKEGIANVDVDYEEKLININENFKSTCVEDNLDNFKDTQKEGIANVDVDYEEKLININENFKNTCVEDNLDNFKDTQKEGIANVDVDYEEKLININENFKNTCVEDNLDNFKDTQKEGIAIVDADLETCNYEKEKLININVNTNDKVEEKFDLFKYSSSCDKASEHVNDISNNFGNEVNLPMYELEYKNLDLNEVNVINEDGCNLNISTEKINDNESRPDIKAANEDELQEEAEQIANINFMLENSLFIEKNLETAGNNLNKINFCPLKRESYFTSLEVINVHNETLSAEYMNDSLNSDFKNLSDQNTEHQQVENTLESKMLSTLEENSNSDNPNNGLLFSHSLSLGSSLGNDVIKLEDGASEFHMDDNLSMKNVSIDDKDKLIYIPLENNSPDSQSSYPSSPEHRFNDTIEEMELLMARGIDYFKDKGSEVDSIVQLPKEGTISSSNSVNSFNPNFDSTHASAGDISKEKVQEEFQNQDLNLSQKGIQLSQVTDMKKIPPEKPPRTMVIEAKPKHVLKQLCDSSQKIISGESTNKTNVSNFSPIVKTITKSKIENCTSKCISTAKSQGCKILYPKKLSPETTPRSTLKKYSLSTPSSKPFIRRAVPLTPTSSNSHPVNIATSKSKIPRLTPPKSNQVFYTPQNLLPSRIKSNVCKSIQPHSKHRTLNIVSPVMKYLQDNPPPPLITTVKPRYKLSPSSCKENVEENVKIRSSSAKREQTIQRINDDVKSIAQKINCKSPLNERNNLIEKSVVLPKSVYMQGESIKLNKENLVDKRTISSDRPPIYILKHKGRVRVPKEALEETDSVGSPAGEKFNYEADNEITTGRTSLMEVSVYEQHAVRHANTLK